MSLPALYPLINQIMAKLFAAEQRRLGLNVKRLCNMHAELTCMPCHGFVWNGEIYDHPDKRHSFKPGERPALAFSLAPEMEDHLADKKQLAKDEAAIRQLLFKLLYQCTDRQELHDAMPACLIGLVPEFAGMQRKYNPEFLLKDPRIIREYSRILPKIELYTATHLIY